MFLAKIFAIFFIAILAVLIYIGVIMYAIAEDSMKNAFKRDDGSEE